MVEEGEGPWRGRLPNLSCRPGLAKYLLNGESARFRFRAFRESNRQHAILNGSGCLILFFFKGLLGPLSAINPSHVMS